MIPNDHDPSPMWGRRRTARPAVAILALGITVLASCGSSSTARAGVTTAVSPATTPAPTTTTTTATPATTPAATTAAAGDLDGARLTYQAIADQAKQTVQHLQVYADGNAVPDRNARAYCKGAAELERTEASQLLAASWPSAVGATVLAMAAAQQYLATQYDACAGAPDDTSAGALLVTASGAPTAAVRSTLTAVRTALGLPPSGS